MKPLIITIYVLLATTFVHAQFSHTTSYKYNHIDGWIKSTESNWFTVDQKGDTTFYTETTEETNQENPSEKKYVFNGAGYRITSGKVNLPIILSAPAKPVLTDWYPVKPLVDSMWVSNNERTVSYKTKYKYRDRYKKTPVKKYVPKKKKVPLPTINVITYKKKLWLMVGKEVLVIEAATKKIAVSKFKTITGKQPFVVTEFSQGDIIH